MEQTLIILKPDAVQRGLMGQIISRFEQKGLKVVAAHFTRLTEEVLAQHYEAHQDKPFYPGLVQFMSDSPVLLMVLEGPEAIAVCRGLMGATFGTEATAGTIRGDLGISHSYNLVHGSDSPESAQRELSLFFSDGELLDYTRSNDPWIKE